MSQPILVFDMDGVLCDSEPFICEAGAHEAGPFRFMERGGGDLLDGDRQVDQSGETVLGHHKVQLELYLPDIAGERIDPRLGQAG